MLKTKLHMTTRKHHKYHILKYNREKFQNNTTNRGESASKYIPFNDSNDPIKILRPNQKSSGFFFYNNNR